MTDTASTVETSTDETSTDVTSTAAVSTVSVTINGREIAAEPGELVIAAAQRHDVYIPRFCYHERMSPVGMCRMCLVEIDTGRGPQLQPSCMVTVTESMIVDTESELTRKVQEGVLEHLLINHPLDCPVCDKGGECSLQDQTLAYGPGESRFVEEKRHFQKPIPVSKLVDLDRERCILCDRCTRFADEVAGDPLISFAERGYNTQILTFPDEPFSSYFSGNTVDLCPVGALTAAPYRFKARPWDLREAGSTCTTCSVGCGMSIQSSRDQLVRFIGVDVDAVNHGWLCDKGRFTFEANNSDHRITAPLLIGQAGAQSLENDPTTGEPTASTATSPVAGTTTNSTAGTATNEFGGVGVIDGGEPTVSPATSTTVSWNTALAKVAAAVTAARPAGVAVIGGAHGTNEDAYAWAKLAQTVFPTGHLDAQLNDGLPASLLAQLPAVTIDEACQADTVVLLGPDIKEELPVLYLRLRAAATGNIGNNNNPTAIANTQLVEVGPVATGLRPYAKHVVECLGGEAALAAKSLIDPTAPNSAYPGLVTEGPEREALTERLANGSVVVVIGRGSLAESEESICAAAQLLAQQLPHAKFLPVLRRANVRGALAMGLAPSPAGQDTAGTGSAGLDTASTVPAGLDTAGILAAATKGDIDVLFLLGADPLADFFDTQLAMDGLAGAGLVVAVDAFSNASVQAADVVLPAAIFGEKDGTTTNLEGRVRAVSQVVTAPVSARPDWLIAAELARHCGHDLGFASRTEIPDEITAQITDEIAHQIPGFAGCGTNAAEQLGGEGVLASLAAGLAADSAATSSATVGDPVGLPRDGYALRLGTTRSLYDAGVAVSHSPSLAQLSPGPALLVSPTDFALIGVTAGTQVRLTSQRASITVPVFDSPAVSRGNAVVRLNQPTSQPGELFAATDRFVDVHITADTQ